MTNLSALTAAETKLTQLKKQVTDAKALISAIGTVTVDSGNKIADARRALMSPPAASVNQALHIPGWIDGDPKQYADFLKWLKG